MYVPKIERNAQQISTFMEKLKEMQEVIQHYDEVLCVKASKGEIDHLKEEVDMGYIKIEQWDDLTTGISKTMQEMQATQSQVEKSIDKFRIQL